MCNRKYVIHWTRHFPIFDFTLIVGLHILVGHHAQINTYRPIVRCAKFWLDMRQGCSQLQNLSVQQTCDIITAAEELRDAFHASVCLFLYYD